MDVEIMNRLLASFYVGCEQIAYQKNRDYHPDNVAYLEILRTAWETGVTVEQDLWGRFRKQLSALRRFVIDGHVESEPPLSRMQDVANYMAILAVWTQCKTTILADALAFQETQPCELADKHFPGHRCGEFCGAFNAAKDPCDACAFRHWLRGQWRASASRAMSSPPTPKPLG